MAFKFHHLFIFYLIAAHLLFAAISGFILFHDRKWLILIELLLVLSLLAGIRLIRHFSGTLDLLRTGTDFIAEQDFSSQFSPVGQSDLDQLVTVYNHMIVQLRQERLRLQEQHYFLDKIITASPLGIVTLDFEGRIDMVNPAAARILEHPGQPLKGLPLEGLVSPFNRTLPELAMGESRIISVGGWRLLKCQKAQFFDRGFSRVFLLLEELTGELRQSEKASYEKLIRLMSHEVNNTVAAASSLLQSCLTFAGQLRAGDRGDYEMALHAVINRAGELNSFMKRFADVVRLPKPIPKPCDLQELLEDLRILLRSELNQRQVAWEWDLQAPLPPIPLDRSLMEQALLNIIRNALEAIETCGIITVRLFMVGECPGLTIADNGAGIPPDAASQLFTPFFSTKLNGQGIGLTLVREIMESHHFRFSLESMDGETRFTILFG